MRNDYLELNRYYGSGASAPRRRTQKAQKKTKKDFASKVIVQLGVSAAIFALVLGACHLPFEFSAKIRNEVQYFLGYSYDFKGAAVSAYQYILDKLPKNQVVPTDAQTEALPSTAPGSGSLPSPSAQPDDTQTTPAEGEPPAPEEGN